MCIGGNGWSQTQDRPVETEEPVMTLNPAKKLYLVQLDGGINFSTYLNRLLEVE
jgi:hypothetical protein